MNKVDLINEIAKKTGFTKIDSEKALEAVFDVIMDGLASGEKVIVSGFGTFEVKERIARVGHDPRTKQEIHIPSMKAATFRTGKVLKERVK